MASNLRDLLGLLSTGSSEKAYDPDTLLPSYPLEGYNVQYIGPGGYAMQGNDTPESWCDNYHYAYYPNWTIPAGTTEVLFEAWGGGGTFRL